MARTRPVGSRISQKPSPPMMVHVRIDRGDARGHGDHRLDGVAAFGQNGAAVLDGGGMRRTDDAAAMSGGVKVHAFM